MTAHGARPVTPDLAPPKKTRKMGRPKFAPLALDEAQLLHTVEELLSRSWGEMVRVRRLVREPSAYATVFPIEILSIDVEQIGRVAMLLKHLGPQDSDHPDKQRRDLEIRVYEGLLGDEGLPVVKFYGSTPDEGLGFYLFLEYVDAWNLKYLDLDHWYQSARRLAHLHAHFAERGGLLWQANYLNRFDVPYYIRWADRTLESLGEVSSELALEIRPIVRDYERVAEILGSSPPTLVHNDLSPKNILAETSSSPARICVIDWDMAGMGCGLLDLVHLKYGLVPDEELRSAYCQELAGTGFLPSKKGELDRLFAACELEKTMHRLWRNRIWHLPIERVAQWVTEAKAYFAQL